jgi:hypothetical protein
MKREALKQSELIQSIGWNLNKMEVKYREDGAIFVYSDVPFTTFRALQRSKHPGEDWLEIRDQYSYKRV